MGPLSLEFKPRIGQINGEADLNVTWAKVVCLWWGRGQPIAQGYRHELYAIAYRTLAADQDSKN